MTSDGSFIGSVITTYGTMVMVNKYFLTVHHRYMAMLCEALKSFFKDGKVPFNPMRSPTLYLFGIKKDITRDCEEIMNTARIVEEMKNTLGSIFESIEGKFTFIINLHTPGILKLLNLRLVCWIHTVTVSLMKIFSILLLSCYV